MHALLRDLAHLPQTVHLKATGIGQDRAFPMREIMQIAMRPNHLHSRAQPQMKGIAQNDLRPHRLQFFRRHGLDRAISAYRHKCRGINYTARKHQLPSASQAIFVGKGKYHCQHLRVE